MRVVLYPNENRSAHVHVIGSGNEAVFQLDCPAASVVLTENYGFSIRDLTRLRSVLLENLAVLRLALEGIHGTEPATGSGEPESA